MGFIGALKLLCLFIFGLLWAELDEALHVEESLREGELEMSRPVSQEQLSERSMAVVYENGSVTINDQDMAVIELSASEAYALLEVLYQQRDRLRGVQEEPKLWLLSEQEVEALAEPMEDEAILREMQEMVACTIAEGEEVLEQEADEMPDWAKLEGR